MDQLSKKQDLKKWYLMNNGKETVFVTWFKVVLYNFE